LCTNHIAEGGFEELQDPSLKFGLLPVAEDNAVQNGGQQMAEKLLCEV
jgi:hypothetical protein